MLHEKIQSTIALIEDVVDNRQKENDNANAAKRNSTFFDSLTKLTPSLTSYVLARKKFNFSLQSNTATDLYPPNNPPFPKTKDPRVRNSGIYFTVICRSSV